MTKPLPTQATLTVTFYFGPGDSSPYRLDKKYIVKNWTDEAHLRRLLDEIAAEMNHLSGYGILSMAVKNDELNFTVDYKERFKLYDPENRHLYYNDFQYMLRFEVGRYSGRRGGPTRLEIPRLNILTPYNQPTPEYEPGDGLFQLRAMSSYSGKKARSAGTMYSLLYDRNNPFLDAFIKKVCKDDVLAPNTKRVWQPYTEHFNLSWWPLPKFQQSWPKRQKLRKEEEKGKKTEERQHQQQEKAGIVYTDKKRTKKADQVYLIQMGEADVYKIGVSNAPGKRLQALNTSNPYELRLVHSFIAEPAADAEAQLHARFADQQMSGEWFRLEPEQVAEVVRITAFEEGRFVKEAA